MRRATWAMRVREALGASMGLLVLAAVALPLSIVARGDTVLPGDVATQRAVQGIDLPGVAAAAQFFNTTGGAVGVSVATVLLAGVLLATRRGVAAALVMTTLVFRVVNWYLKEMIASPRPTGDLVTVSERADGFGFPSGHTMGAVLLWGVVFVLAGGIAAAWPRRLLRAFAVLTVLAVGLSRIYSGAHWPSDVVGAMLWGVLLLMLLLGLDRALRTTAAPARRDNIPTGRLALAPRTLDRR